MALNRKRLSITVMTMMVDAKGASCSQMLERMYACHTFRVLVAMQVGGTPVGDHHEDQVTGNTTMGMLS